MKSDSINIRCFGPLQVSNPTGEVRIAGRTSCAVLSALVIHANEPVACGRLAELVWSSDLMPGDPQHALHTHITRLRRLLGNAAIATDQRGYHLVVDPERVDLWRFERAVQSGDQQIQRGRYASAAGHYEQALSECGHHRPLGDLDRSTAGRAERARLIELQLEAEERHAACAMLAHQPIMGDLEPLVMSEPLRELRWAVLMCAQARSGRQADALRSFRRAAAALRDVGLSPGQGLRSVESRILEQDPALGEVEVEELLTAAL